MATELRRIFLSSDELLKATHSYLRVNVELVGAVSVSSTHVCKDGTLSVRFVRTAQPGKPKGDILLQKEQVVELLIRFCMENNIPIPRNGKKAVVVRDRGIALQIKVGELETVSA